MVGDRVGRFPRWSWRWDTAPGAAPKESAVADARAMSQRKTSDTRFLLWVDGVGGYLVCREDVVMLGQAVPGSGVQIPLLGDLSRQHAVLERLGDRYLLRPLQSTRLSGRPVEGPTLLTDGVEIEMGTSVRLRFRQPHALSASARLEFASPHKTVPTVDAILLMAESCLLGGSANHHVVCRGWEHDLVLFRKNGGLGCRVPVPFEVDGIECAGRCDLPVPARVVGTGFSFSLEALS